MKSWIINHHETVLTVLIALMICVTRSSMAIGNVLYGVILLVATIAVWCMRDRLNIPTFVRRFGAVYGGMLLCVLPSALLSSHISVTMSYFVNIWVWKALIMAPILLLIKSQRKLYILLSLFFLYMAVDAVSAFVQYKMAYNVSEQGRSGGVFRGTVMGLAMLLTFAFPLALITAYDKAYPWYVRLSATISSLGMLLGMWGNQSRGSWIFNGFNSLWITVRYAFKNVVYLFVLIAFVLGIGYIFQTNPTYVERFESTFNTTTDGSNLGRIYVWESDKRMIQDHPVIGVGPGLWQSIYRQSYRLPEETQNLGHSHNNLLQITAESGVLGLVGFLAFSLFMVCYYVRQYMRHKNPYDLSIVVGFVSYIYLFGSIDYTWGNSSGIRIFWVVIAIMMQLSYKHHRQVREGLIENKN